MLLPHPKRHRDLPNIFKRETSSYLTGPRPIVDVLPESRPFHQGDGLLCPKPCCAGRSETELCGVWTELSVPASSNLCFQNNRARDVCESSAQNRAREQADRRQDRCVRLQPRKLQHRTARVRVCVKTPGTDLSISSKSFWSHDRFIKGTDVFSVPSQDVVDEARYSSVARGQSCPSPRPPTCVVRATARVPNGDGR